MFLVTGGAGFIGSNIVKQLIQNDCKVRVIDNLSSGNLDNLNGYLDKLELFNDNICDPAIGPAFNNVSFVLHQAAVASVERSIKDPVETVVNNVLGTINVLEQARKAGVKRVILASTAAVYGDTEEMPLKEGYPAKPLSPYAISKYNCETYAYYYSSMHGLETVVLRYFNVFGPNQDPASDYSSVISKFLERIISGNSPVIFGDGLQTRDFVYVQNVVNANILAVQSPRVGKGEVINIASGNSICIHELVDTINTVLAADYKPAYQEARKGEVRFSRGDISKARDLLDYKPEINLVEGLRNLVKWLQVVRSVT